MKIGVIGGGTVGLATARAFMEWADVRVYDTQKEKATHSSAEVLRSDLIFICLPTPQGKYSLAPDMSIIEGFFSTQEYSHTRFALKSTVPVGTTKRLREKYHLSNLVHSPEFLTARCAVTDAQMPARNIVGGVECEAKEFLKDLYCRRFPGVQTFLCSSDESEAVKLICNGFFAVKIAFFNEVRALADKIGMDWDRVIEAVLADGRIAHSHTQVPGPDGKYGFGGVCLPKDLANLITTLKTAGVPSQVTCGAHERNRWDRERK